MPEPPSVPCFTDDVFKWPERFELNNSERFYIRGGLPGFSTQFDALYNYFSNAKRTSIRTYAVPCTRQPDIKNMKTQLPIDKNKPTVYNK